MGYSLGVDLGTTYSAAAVAQGDRVEVFTLGAVAPAIPSVVLLRADGEVLVGEAAERRAITEPTRTGREFKRRLGDPAPLVLGGTPYGAESLMAHLLRAIVDAVSERQGRRPDRITVTHPANYGPYKKELLVEMARLGDVGRVDFLTEPEAAAISYAQQDRLEPGEVVAVYDFGGGTFDAAVLRKTPDGFEPLGQPEGMERLGGIDFDQAIVAHVNDAVGGQVSEVDSSDPMAWAALARLRADIRSAKESLSTDTDVTIPVMLPGLQTDVRLTRGEFEAMIRPRIVETIAALERAVRSAGIQMADVDRILLVGGSSRIPLVGEMIRAATGRPVSMDAHPKFAIALGAARAGADSLAADAASIAPPLHAPEEAQPAPMPFPAEPVGRRGATAIPAPAAPAATRRSRTPFIAAILALLLLVGGGIVAFAMLDGDSQAPIAGGSPSSAPSAAVSSTAPSATGSSAPSGAGATPAPRGTGDQILGTLAGITSAGNGGDGGPAAAAQLSPPGWQSDLTKRSISPIPSTATCGSFVTGASRRWPPTSTCQTASM